MATLGHSNPSLPDDRPTTSRWRRNRASANLLEQVAQPALSAATPPATTSPPKLERAPSKMSLFNLFSRPKVEKARGHTEVGLAVPMGPPTPPPKNSPVSPPKSALRLNPPPAVQQAHRSRSSQMLRPMSSIRTPNMKKDTANWEPPPLFQVYPQSILHAKIQACVYSPDALLRTHSQRKQYDLLRERIDSHRDLASTVESGAETKKLEKTHKRLASNSVMHPATPQLTDKVYALVTSGYVLQYSGDGSFDRLPEKILKLGKESAAFASDAIPGKHFVLQISQSAKEDGTVEPGPKSSLLSRLRLQSTMTRKTASSFLLVLDSAEEMKQWMTAVRKEIDSLGGMKFAEESIRESVSIDETPKQSQESATPSHRYLVKRDPNRMSKAHPVDSPLQSQYSESPKVVTTEWTQPANERKMSSSDTASIQSSRHSISRPSIEVASIATRKSHEQMQLDHLRDKSRYSYVSTAATSVSGPGTRNTSRNSSPAPNSPLKEEESTPVDAEPLRSATSLRSFHMNPSSNTTNRRRSMHQPLPVTNEDTAFVADAVPTSPQRHTMYGPISPTLSLSSPTLGRLEQKIVVRAPATSAPTKEVDPKPTSTSQLAPLLCQPTKPQRYSTLSPLRSGMRSSSAPPIRHGAISPPPRDPAPSPSRPHSTIGSQPITGTLAPPSSRRLSQGPKPFLRPFPVRPQAQHADGSLVVPRRLSSLGPPTIPLGIVVNRSVTTPVKTPSSTPTTTSIAPQANASRPMPASQQLRRPNSVQIRSDHAPFLSTSRPTAAPARAISSTPSFIPGKRASSTPHVRSAPPTSSPKEEAQHQAPQARAVTPRRSMPVIGLPPPAPPPNMPLPPPPPVAPPRSLAVS
jgi:hypothetical protein